MTTHSETNLVWQLKPFAQLTAEELYILLALRSEVFVVEQACAYQDLDGMDQRSMHLMGWQDEQLVAYARLLPPGLLYDTASIGRVVTRGTIRGMGIGKLLMGNAMDAVRSVFGPVAVTISAQAHLEVFYNTWGFVKHGAPYLEDGIPHVRMISSAPSAGNLG